MTITRVRATPGGTDAYGDPIAGTVDRLDLPTAYTAPRTADDVLTRGRHGVVVGLTLFAPHGTDLEHTDRVDVDGVMYEIEGDPANWSNPFTGWKPGLTVSLKRAAG